MKNLQEKFQTILPSAPNEDDGNEWTDVKQSRFLADEEKRHRNNTSPLDNVEGKYNEMPVNMELKNERTMHRDVAGCTDVSYDANPESFANGFTRRAMNGSDDQYTGEHADHFYGEAVDEKGRVGFAERNNYLDRI